MLKQSLALSLFFVLPSYAMDKTLRESREDIMNELYVASKENRTPSPVVIKEIEKIADAAFEHNDADLLVSGAQYLSKGTLLRMSDGCVQKLRANALLGRHDQDTIAILSAMTRTLQKGDK